MMYLDCFDPKWVNTAGLALDAVGVMIIFWFAWPQPDLNPTVFLAMEGDQGRDESTAKKRGWYKVLSIFGLVCLVSGFGLQIVATWMI